MSIVVTCTCGKRLQVPDQLAGKRGKCAGCGNVLAIPAPPEPAASRTCPSCREPVGPVAILCVNCGHDFRTGERVRPADPDEPAEHRPKRSKQEAAPPSRMWIAWLISGIGVVATAIILTLQPWKRTPSDPAPATSLGDSLTKKLPSGGTPSGTASPQPLPTFDEALRDGRIAWQPVKNIQITTKTPTGSQTEVFDFRVNLKYDSAGRPSPDTTGQKAYSWPGREVLFGSGAVIRVARDATVREGELRAGAEWTWTGQQWIAATGQPQATPSTLTPAPAASPTTEWARRTAKRLDDRKLSTVSPQKRVLAFTKSPAFGDTIKEWRAALDMATGEQVEVLALTIFLSQFGKLWNGEEFLPAQAQKYAARIKQLPKDTARAWSDEFRNVSPDRMESLNAALALSQMDYLFDSERFRTERATQLLPRVKSLNKPMLQLWAEALSGDTLEAAVELIDLDWLFDGDTLKPAAATDALQALTAARTKK
jgi:hypothetical protein